MILCALLLLGASACTPGAGESAEPGDGSGTGADRAELAPFYDQKVHWSDCGEGFECATLAVPLDYADPDGARLDIALKRLPARESGRIGSLVVNPGGPGGSGIDYVGAAATIVSEAVRARFDLVGFDPRGVGASSPVYCMGTTDLDAFQGAEFDTEDGDGDQGELTPEGVREMRRQSKRFAESCQQESGGLLPHIGTADVARDLDVLRAALGDKKLSYLGKSYGTSIGTHYADQFPRRVRALVLDGALDPVADPLRLSVEQAEGFTTALDAFVADCLRRTDCPLGRRGGAPKSALKRLTGLLADIGREPLSGGPGDGREVTRSRAEFGLLGAMYSEGLWPQARNALDAAFDGDGAALLRLGDRIHGRDRGEAAFRNSAAALVAVSCADNPVPRSIAPYREAVAEAAEASPLFGPGLAWSALACAYWPEDAVAEAVGPDDLDAEGAAPILVVGTTRDSATPYHWAKGLAARLDSGVLLTRDGDGHTGYRMGDDCIDAAVDRYLISGDVPGKSTDCT